MSIYKSSLIFGLSTSAKIVSGLIIIKMMARILSPEQFGVIGQLMTAIAIVGMFSGGGAGNGIIKMLASRESFDKKLKIISAALAILIFSCGVISLILIFGSGLLSNFVFGNSNHKWVFVVLAVSQIFVGLGNLILAIISSRNQAWVFTKINLYGTLAGLASFLMLIHFGGFIGVTYGLVLIPSAVGLFSLWILHKEKIFTPAQIFRRPNLEIVKQLLSYSLVMLVAVSVLPLSQMITRNYVGSRAGWAAVGYWQGVLKISDTYMQFIGIILINYALPRFAICENAASARAELKRVLIPLLLIGAVILAFIYSLRIFVIDLIFSKNYLPMKNYFLPQLIGDLFRIISSAITYMFLARNNKIMAILSEIFQGLAFFGFTVLLFPLLNAVAPVYAHLLTFFLLAIIMMLCFHFYLKNNF